MAQENDQLNKNQKELSLRSFKPELYTYIVTELESQHIHPYDVQVNAVEETTGLQIIVRFGEGFAHEQSQLFSFSSIEKIDRDLVTFIKETSEACKQTMIADYFKMMKI